MSRSMPRAAGLVALGFVMVALTGFGLAAQGSDLRSTFVVIALAQGAVYALAVCLVWNGGLSRRVLAMILAVAALMRLAALVASPYLSTDIYRYVWDGRVQAAGINPYLYIPNDPHLQALRDAQIFPKINRNNYAPTIYPPVAEAIFFAATRVADSVTGMKAAIAAIEVVGIAVLMRLLTASLLPAERVIAYAWHPLTIWEFAGSGHIDAAVFAFVAISLWSRRSNSPWGAGIALGCATLVKFFPAVIFPALYRRWDWRMPTAFAATLLLGYVPFLGAGSSVLGFLPGYVSEEGLASGDGFYLWNLAKAILPLTGVSVLPYLAFAAAVMAGIGIRALLDDSDSRDRFVVWAAVLATAFTVLLSPHYPWYFAYLTVFLCFVRSPSLLWLTTASLILYLIPVGSRLVADRHRLLVESALYGPFAAIALFELWRHHRDPLEKETINGHRPGQSKVA